MDISNLAEENGVDLPEPTQSLHEILNRSVRHYPKKTALVSCHQSGNLMTSLGHMKDTEHNGDVRMTYAQLDNLSKILASYLAKNGVRKGQTVVVIVYSTAEWALCFWAAARLACPFVPINPAIVGRAVEIQHVFGMLNRIGALIAGDESIVKTLLAHSPAKLAETSMKLILGYVGVSGWTAFDDIFRTPDLSQPFSVEHNMADTVLIVLTSGTTAMPKGCPHSNKTVAAMCARHKIMYSLDETRVSCNHMPLFHLAGVMESLWAWACGGKVVYPNKTFDARSTIDAIDGERCTDMCLVPSMLRAMVDHPVISTRNTRSLGLIKLAANDVQGSDARACSEILHAKVVTNCFGTTESSGMTEIFAWQDGLFKDSEPFPVGRMAPGARARICAPGLREPVKRGVIGELHQGGLTIIDRYIGGSDDALSFYKDQTSLWHISGDRAIMAKTGEITVLGRYKDIINRAGENISASNMERVLNQIQGVQSSQVIGVPDEVAGEVPVAVVKTTTGENVPMSLIQDRIVKELGVACALERIVYLKELAIDEFPTTATGKVRKVELKQLVLEHLRFGSSMTRMVGQEPTEAALTRLWARFIGVPENQISPTMSLEGMVDSVTVMRFRSQVKKDLGKTFSLEELNLNPTVVQQAALLDRQQDSVLRHNDARLQTVRKGPSRLDEIVQARGSPLIYDEVRRGAEEKLYALGLSWEKDVEEVLPIYDFLTAWRAVTDSVMFRIGYVCVNATTEQLRSALENVLSVHGILRTILLESPSAGPSWLMIRSSSHWFDLAIMNGGTVNKPEDLETVNLSSEDCKKPTPLFFIKIYFIKATQSAGFVAYGDHSTYDAHSVLSLFIEDLGRALSDPFAALPARPGYGLFAKLHYNYRTSVPAQLNLDYFASRINGIAQHRRGLWPAESFRSMNGPPERTADQLLLQGKITPGLAGIVRHIKIDMSNNQYLKVHKIPHVVAIKAAIAIFSTQQTDYPHAFFCSLQMCRSYPYLERQIADRLPDPMDMPGATVQMCFNSLHLAAEEQISTLLPRMLIEQNMQTARAQYPSLRLHEQLEAKDMELVGEIFQRQAINYNPVVTPDPEAPLQHLQWAGNANLSFIWWCGMIDAETMQMRVTWNDEVFGVKEAEEAIDGFERNMKWLVNGENWDKTIGDCGY
ncbi:MAG: hypothetical protein Q9209_005931 [Squamulea sp. 1 TL-2023]